MVSRSSDRYTTCSVCLEEFTQGVEENKSMPQFDQLSLAEKSRDLIRHISRQMGTSAELNQSAVCNPNQSAVNISDQSAVRITDQSAVNITDQSGEENNPRQLQRELSSLSTVSTESCDPAYKRILGLLPCEHVFHFRCIWTWLVLRGACPVCKQQICLWDIKAVLAQTFVLYIENQLRKKELDLKLSKFKGAVSICADAEFRSRTHSDLSTFLNKTLHPRSRTNTINAKTRSRANTTDVKSLDSRKIRLASSAVDPSYRLRVSSFGSRLRHCVYINRYVNQTFSFDSNQLSGYYYISWRYCCNLLSWTNC